MQCSVVTVRMTGTGRRDTRPTRPYEEIRTPPPPRACEARSNPDRRPSSRPLRAPSALVCKVRTPQSCCWTPLWGGGSGQILTETLPSPRPPHAERSRVLPRGWTSTKPSSQGHGRDPAPSCRPRLQGGLRWVPASWVRIHYLICGKAGCKAVFIMGYTIQKNQK